MKAPGARGARFVARVLALGLGALLLPVHATSAEHLVPLFLSAEDPGRSSFVRVINRSSTSGRVRVEAVDDSGRKPAAVMLDIAAKAVVHFNSKDLATGNRRRGLEGSIGRPVSGDWRLTLLSELDIEGLSYVRARDGLVTAMHDTAPWSDGGLRIPFFNPGSNTRQVSSPTIGRSPPRWTRTPPCSSAATTTARTSSCSTRRASAACFPAQEPVPVLEGTHLRINVDVGRQSTDGEAAVVLGNVANSRSCEEAPEWELKAFPVRSLPAPVTASPEGRVWLLFGVDSGFEGRTEIYFTRASVTFMPVLGRA